MGSLFGTNAPPLLSPESISKTPTLAEASTTSLQNQLNKEGQSRMETTTPLGGSGLLDEPTTTASVLMGS